MLKSEGDLGSVAKRDDERRSKAAGTRRFPFHVICEPKVDDEDQQAT